MLYFLNQEDLVGNKKLEIFKKIGIEAQSTDWALFEARMLQRFGETQEKKISSYLITNENYGKGNMQIIGRVDVDVIKSSFSSKVFYALREDYTAGIRPKFKYSEIKEKVTDITVDEHGIKRGKCFRFMNHLVTGEERKRVINYWKANEITENVYEVIDSDTYGVVATEKQRHTVWFENQEYMAVSNPIKENDILIFTVEPCNILIDEKKDTAVFENVISYGLRGLDSNYNKYYYLSDFDVAREYLRQLNYRLIQEEPRQLYPTNQVTLHITEEMLKHLANKKELTFIQENTSQIKIKVDNSTKTFIKSEKKENKV